jgi:hypothetical protein
MSITALTSPYVTGPDGILIHAPYGVLDQGLLASRPNSRVVVLIMHIGAVEDPRFGPWLTRSGVYRVEDSTGTIARIGQGHVLGRVRQHRIRRVVLPQRLIAAVPRTERWSAAERCWLESRWARYWLDAGKVLASTTFLHHFPELDAASRSATDALLAEIIALVDQGLRLAGGDITGFSPAQDAGAPAAAFGAAPPRMAYHRQFTAGTELVYEDGRIRARAVAQHRSVQLHPGSLVRLTPCKWVGPEFVRAHRQFVEMARVELLDDDIGRTRQAVAAPTAAALVKRVTGGRTHNGDRWQQQPEVGSRD